MFLGRSSGALTRFVRRDPFPYTPETVEHEDTKLKAIYTQPAKHGKTPDTYFGKEHLYVAKVRFKIKGCQGFTCVNMHC